MVISRAGRPLALPSSRKVRALIGYLALTPRPVTRSALCELLWDVPNDPRGELRWCLSKARSILDEPARRRIETSGDTVALDLADCAVDAREAARVTQLGLESFQVSQLREACALFAGDFLDGLEVDRSPQFNAWLIAQRRHFRSCHTALLEHLTRVLPGSDAFAYLEKWLQLAPFDQRVHETMLNSLSETGRLREGEEHLAATMKQFEAEGLDTRALRESWRAAIGKTKPQPPRIAAVLPPSATSGVEGAAGSAPARRASIAVMPFVDQGAADEQSAKSAGGLVHDIITRLAKLRSLFVIAQGTVFALHERHMSPGEAGRTLNVDYVVSGSLRRQPNRVTVAVELVETRTARIVWAEVFDHALDGTLLILDEIGNRIVASIASEVETAERNRAILKPPCSLDAWDAYHRGVWHMYRFNKADNEKAHHFFEMAARLDPTFARAHAGLSFTHFQNAFQGWAERQPETEKAYAAAGESLMADDLDPAAHWAMGRALWLHEKMDQSVSELERAVDLSPNFALAHYTLAFVHSQSGDAQAAVAASDLSRQLSPFDPMLFAMFGARAMALVRLGRFEEAAEWAIKAAARPNAHAHILAIAAYSLALADRLDEARVMLAAIRRAAPHYGVEDCLAAFRFAPEGAALFRKAAKRINRT